MNIIEELYYGNIKPYEKRYSYSQEFLAYSKALQENERELIAFLSSSNKFQKERECLEKMIKSEMEISGFCQKEIFIEGFRLGVKLMIDTYIVANPAPAKNIP